MRCASDFEFVLTLNIENSLSVLFTSVDGRNRL